MSDFSNKGKEVVGSLIQGVDGKDGREFGFLSEVDQLCSSNSEEELEFPARPGYVEVDFESLCAKRRWLPGEGEILLPIGMEVNRTGF